MTAAPSFAQTVLSYHQDDDERQRGKEVRQKEVKPADARDYPVLSCVDYMRIAHDRTSHMEIGTDSLWLCKYSRNCHSRNPCSRKLIVEKGGKYGPRDRATPYRMVGVHSKP